LTVGGSWAVPAIATSGPALARRAAIPNAAVTSTAPRFVVNGDLTTTPGSTVALEVHDAQAPVQVNGAASFTGTQFNIVVDDTSKTRLESYPLVKADAVSLASSTVSAQTSTLAPVLFADPTTLRVSVLNLLVPLSAVPTTKNGRAIATAIDTLKPATGEMRALIRNLAGLEDQSLRAAFDQMTGQVNTTNARMVVMDSEAITDLIRAEMSRDAESELEIGSGSGRSGMWVEAVGAHARFSATGDLSGAVVNLGGLAGGYDLLRGDRFTFGGGLSFTSGDLSLDSLKEASQMSAPRGFAYAGVRVGPFRFHGGGSAAKTNTTSTREIHIQQGDPNRDPGAAAFDATAQAERNGNANDAWSEWQDTFRIKSWTTESKVGWRHARFARQAFTEQGGGPVSLQSSGSTLTLTESDVLVRTFKRSGQYRPYFMFTYRRSFGDPSNSEDSQFVNQPTATFAVQGLPMATNTVMGRTGLTVHLGVGLEFTLEYEFRRAEFETRHTVDFRVRMR
jgi:outer membrane autotransporter protein